MFLELPSQTTGSENERLVCAVLGCGTGVSPSGSETRVTGVPSDRLLS